MDQAFPPYLDEEGARRLIEPIGFADPRAAARNVRALALLPAAAAGLGRLWPWLATILRDAASPDRALNNLARFVQAAPDNAALLGRLADDRRLTEMLVTLFAGSQFLSEILLRDGADLGSLADRQALVQLKSAAQFAAEARAALAGRSEDRPPSADVLRRYQRRELLRIGLGDLCGLLDLPSVVQQLSNLAEGIVNVALELAAAQTETKPDGFAVLALGKLGSAELNYSSDIDLLFLAEADAARFQRLGERLIAVLAEATAEGFLYRVDMRLRPWGAVGPLIVTVPGYLKYLKETARLWEKQALLRGRPIAGNRLLGQDFLDRAGELIFATDREAVRADVYAMKQRTEARLRATGRHQGEVKLGEGSIRDVEFVVQFLQLTHGAAYPDLRRGAILDLLDRLAEHDLISADEHRILAAGYVFLRTVEHYLQILDYRQTHILPTNPADLRYLAQRLGYSGPQAAERFVTRYQQHSAAVRAIYWRYLAAPAGSAGGSAMTMAVGQPSFPGEHAPTDPDEAQVRQHIARMSPSYAEAFSAQEIRRHADLAARLSDSNPVEVRAEQIGASRWRVTIVAYDYLGELSA
ncbi:MAG: hypothetical protein ACP5UQ_17075, partial [Anaerolineae bacterium]